MASRAEEAAHQRGRAKALRDQALVKLGIALQTGDLGAADRKLIEDTAELLAEASEIEGGGEDGERL